MRALLAAALALGLVLAAAVPHGHAASHGECAVCVARQGDVARSETPDLEPGALLPDAVPQPPAASPVSGAPLGAIPGQSPPGPA